MSEYIPGELIEHGQGYEEWYESRKEDKVDRFEERWELKEHANEIRQLEDDHEKELGEYQDELEIAQTFINSIGQHEEYMTFRSDFKSSREEDNG